MILTTSIGNLNGDKIRATDLKSVGDDTFNPAQRFIEFHEAVLDLPP